MTNQALIPSTIRDQWLVLKEEAQMALDSGLLPKSITTPAQAVTIAMAGRELGISTWRALNGISVISGRTVISGELMLQLILQHQGPDAIVIEETDERHVVLSYRRKGSQHVGRYEFTYEQADKAGLTRNPVYRQHPARMLLWRAVSHVARMRFPDVISGAYVEGEIEPEQEQPATIATVNGGATRKAAPPPAPVVEGEIVAPPPLPPAPVLRQALAADLFRRFSEAGLPPPPPDPKLDDGARDAVLSDALNTLVEREAPSEKAASEAGLAALRKILAEFNQAGVALAPAIPPSASRAKVLHSLLVGVKKRATTGEVGDVHRAPEGAAAPDVDLDQEPY